MSHSAFDLAKYADLKWSAVKCDICHQTITSARTASLVFEAYRENARAPFIAHDRCYDDSGTYLVSLHRIVEWGNEKRPYETDDSFCSWRAHLSGKNWWLFPFELDLVRAWGFAQSITGRRSRPREREKMSPAIRARILERDDFRCRRCGAGPNDAKLVVDHILAIALDGKTEDENLQTLCADCNSGKSARRPHAHDLAAVRR